MSEQAAAKCGGKKRYTSPRRAADIAKLTGRKYATPMNAYSCEFCKGWHVGSTHQRNGRRARMAREGTEAWQG